MTVFFYDETACPHCGYRMDAASAIEGDDVGPSEGDVSICIRCGGVMVWIDRFNLRRPSKSEEEKILQIETIRRVRRAIKKLAEMRDGTAEPRMN